MAHIFFDFDSTLVSVETLDELLCAKVKNNPEKQAKIQHITEAGMNGEVPLKTSLTSRLEIATLTQSDIEKYKSTLVHKISTGLEEVIAELHKEGHIVHIISGGFKDYMGDVAKRLNIPKSCIHANTFTVDSFGNITGFDETNPLCMNHGKGQTIESLQIQEPILMVGDGSTDLEVFTSGKCHQFIGFCLHAKREKVEKSAPILTGNIEEFKTQLYSWIDEQGK